MAETSPGETANPSPFIIFCALSFLFFTLSLIKYVFVVFTIWSFALGIALGFLLISNYHEVPNLLLLAPFKIVETVTQYGKSDKPVDTPNVCTVCKKVGCPRHRPEVSFQSLNPWENLLVPSEVDKALTEFLEITLRAHVYTWYWDLGHDQGFVDEMRRNLRFMVAILIRRLRKVDIPKFLLTKCLKRFMIHLECYAKTKERVSYGNDLQAATLKMLDSQKHFAMENETVEVDYMRYLTELILQHLLPKHFLSCKSATVLLRELMTNIILIPTAEKISDPDFVNQLLLVLLDDEPLKEATKTPSPNVCLLASFAKPRAAQTTSALSLSVFELIHNTNLLLPFMQFMRKEGGLNVLQFCLDIEDFNKRSLAPELSSEEQKRILTEAREIHKKYFQKDAVDFIDFPEDVVQDLEEGLASQWTVSSRLRTAEPLFKAYEYAFNLLEYNFAPLFHQSDEFYQILCGPREIEQPKKEAVKVQKKKFMPLAELSRLASKIKAKKRSVKEDKALAIFLDEFDPPGTPPEMVDEEEELPDDFHGEMIPEIVVDPSESRDLSYLHITVPRIDSIFEKNKKVYVFVITVERIGTKEGFRQEEKWQVLRKYSEFFVLGSKLRRFHGAQRIAELPGKRTILKKDLDFLNNCRSSFQEYLQSLVRNPVLRGSGLLHIFLSPGSELTGMFEPESMGREAGRKIKSIKSKLMIERGQNLDEFLQAFLVSAEPPKKKLPPRPQNEKSQRGSSKPKPNSKLFLPARPWSKRPKSGSFEDNPQKLDEMTVTDYIIFAARTLLKVPSSLQHILVFGRFLGKNTLNAFIEKYVSYKVSLATQEDQLVNLIHLLRDAVFFDLDPPRTDTRKLARRDETFQKMLEFLPDVVKRVLGNETHDFGIRLVFELLQHPKLNKQLVYTLFDELVVELFPEFSAEESSITNVAKDVY